VTVPKAKDLGKTIVDTGKNFVKNAGVVGGALKELGETAFSYDPRKGGLIPGMGSPTSLKRGGVVKKTGLIKMHKGEKVIPAKKVKKVVKKKKKGCK
jgi:hypothetical protein